MVALVDGTNMDNYTTEELKRGRFLWHFMGLEPRRRLDATAEDEALPADAEPQGPPRRMVQRPQR